jgi:glycine oxidase
MNITPDFCIIGGGIAALTLARMLAQDGRSIVLVERNRPGTGASHAAAGMLAPLIEARLEEESIVRFGLDCLQYYPEFVSALEEETGERVDYRREGTLIVGIDRDDLEHLRHLYDEQRRLGLPVEWLSGYECRQLEPCLATGIPGGIFSPQDHQVDNRQLIRALMKSLLMHAGVTMIEEAGAGEFQNGAASGSLQFTTGRHTISAGQYIVATGAHGDSLATLLPDMARLIRPVKGQIMRLDQTRMPLVDHVVRSPEMYLVPKSNGELVLGASAEDRGFDESVTAGPIFELLRAAWECVPGIYELPIIETIVGFRPATIDHAPLIGETELQQVALATGYYRHGILFAPYCAKLLSDRLLHGAEHEWLEKFSPARFNAVDI